MGRTEEQELVRIDVKFPFTGFPRTHFFNRVRVEKEPAFLVAQFGLVTGSGVLDSYGCIIPNATLEHGKESLLGYYERIASGKGEPPPSWQGAAMGQRLDVVDFIHLAHRSDQAEILLFVVSMWSTTIVGKSEARRQDGLQAQPVALLRSTLELQRFFIGQIYGYSTDH
jgi:hypothetical protein